MSFSLTFGRYFCNVNQVQIFDWLKKSCEPAGHKLPSILMQRCLCFDRLSAAPTQSTAVPRDTPVTWSLEAALSTASSPGTLCSGTERKTRSNVDFNPSKVHWPPSPWMTSMYSSCYLWTIRAFIHFLFCFATDGSMLTEFLHSECSLQSSMKKKKKHFGLKALFQHVQESLYLTAVR